MRRGHPCPARLHTHRLGESLRERVWCDSPLGAAQNPGEGTMTPVLSLLVWSVVLMFAQMLIAVSGATLQVGLVKLAGNREDLPAITGWAGRAQRAHRNMIENLVLFAALVLVAHVTGKANATVLLGAQLFFWGRLAYALVYLAGIPWLRTGVWLVAVVGMILIFIQIIR